MADWSAAEAYRRSFGVLCAGAIPDLLDAVGRPPGALLDVGTGPGTVALAAMRRGWRVDAVEPDASMRAVAAGSTGLDVRDGALPALPVPDRSNDAVVANFVVNHLSDPRAGVRELVRVARPGALVAVTFWLAAPNALSAVWAEVMEVSGATPPPGVRLPPHLDFARSEAGGRTLLADAGALDTTATTLRFPFVVRGGDLWSAVEGGLGVIGTTYRAAAPAVQRAMVDVFEALVARVSDRGVLTLPAEAVLVCGSAPAPQT